MEKINDPAYKILIDPPRKYVEVHMIGLWDAATVQRFDRDLRRLLPALPKGGCRMGEQITLFDSTAFPVQPQDVSAHLAGMAADRSIGSRRIAVLVSGVLNKLQTRRIAPGYHIFDDRNEALAWLAEPDD